MTNYSSKKVVNFSFEETLNRVEEELSKEGFGILTRIDVKETLKKKLGVKFPKYVILGACNPPNARKSLELEQEIGLLLPCNVIVYEDGEETLVSVIKPTVMLSIVENKELDPIAEEIEAKLKRALTKV